jgi:hypothetical protein
LGAIGRFSQKKKGRDMNRDEIIEMIKNWDILIDDGRSCPVCAHLGIADKSYTQYKAMAKLHPEIALYDELLEASQGEIISNDPAALCIDCRLIYDHITLGE